MFNGILIEKDEAGYRASYQSLSEEMLPAGDVTVAVEWSSLNYKDGLALTGAAPVVRRFPLIPGIDFAGTVLESQHPDWHPGDKVVLNGWGVGETHSGGLAERARVRGDWLVALPERFQPRDAMAIGTAGYTAMLCVMALEKHGITPGDGDILVTGANGGVGSVAITLLAKLGYRVVAATGRLHEADYLTSLGAAEVIDRAELATPDARWARNAGPASSTPSAATPWPMPAPLPATAAPWPPAVWREGWTSPPPSCPSSCAASPSMASTA